LKFKSKAEPLNKSKTQFSDQKSIQSQMKDIKYQCCYLKLDIMIGVDEREVRNFRPCWDFKNEEK
jgi:hypothetical protein